MCSPLKRKGFQFANPGQGLPNACQTKTACGAPELTLLSALSIVSSTLSKHVIFGNQCLTTFRACGSGSHMMCKARSMPNSPYSQNATRALHKPAKDSTRMILPDRRPRGLDNRLSRKSPPVGESSFETHSPAPISDASETLTKLGICCFADICTKGMRHIASRTSHELACESCASWVFRIACQLSFSTQRLAS